MATGGDIPGDGRTDLGHGPRLSGEEYDRAIVRLHEAAPAAPNRRQDRDLRRASLDLRIDHRLGRDFPEKRREELWQVQEEVEERRLWLAGKWLLGHLVGRRSPPLVGADRLAGWMVDRFARVLRRDELGAFFGGDEPALPYDPQDDTEDD